MGEDDRLAELVSAMADLRVELAQHAERHKAIQDRLEDRDQAMRSEFERLHILLRAELEGYLRGHVDSINGNISAIHRELVGKTGHISGRVVGLSVVCGLLGALVVVLVEVVTRTPP